jgi:hypothetical protein
MRSSAVTALSSPDMTRRSGPSAARRSLDRRDRKKRLTALAPVD